MTAMWNEALVPTHMQCALNGCWEQALRIDLHNRLPTQGKFNAWLGQSPDFALEVFFQKAAGNCLFTGVRFKGSHRDALYDRLCAVWTLLERCRDSGKAMVPAQFMRQALALHLFAGGPRFLEVGVNNRWKSAGSCTLWNSGDAPMQVSAAISKLLARAPQLLALQPSNVMLEIAFDEPRPHWLGVEVSKPVAGGFRLNLDLLEHGLRCLDRPQADW